MVHDGFAQPLRRLMKRSRAGTRRRNSARLHPQTYIPAFQKRQTSLVSGQRAAQKSELHAPLTGMPNLRAWGLDVKADP